MVFAFTIWIEEDFTVSVEKNGFSIENPLSYLYINIFYWSMIGIDR